jgi:hypothetical protein
MYAVSSKWVAQLTLMAAMMTSSSLTEGASVEEHDAVAEEIKAVDEDLEGLEQKKQALQDQYEKTKADVAKWKALKTGRVIAGEAAEDVEEDSKQELEETQEKQEEVAREKEELLARKIALKKKLKAAIPPPPWKSHVTPAPDDFETRRNQAYEKYIWSAKFAPTKEGRDSARGVYEKDYERIDEEEKAAQQASAKKKPTVTPQNQGTPTPVAVPTQTVTASPPPQVVPPPQGTVPASAPSSGPGKENPPEVWELGAEAPAWVFLSDEEIRIKKEAFTKSIYGFHEIQNQDGRVIDVVANKDPATEAPPVGHITAGKGKDAKTTAYGYEEKTVTLADGSKEQRSTSSLLWKQEFPSINEQIDAIRKQQLKVFQADTDASRAAYRAWSDADFENENALRLKYGQVEDLREKHWTDFEQRIRKLDPSYQPRPAPIMR